MPAFQIVPVESEIADRVRASRDDGHGNIGLEPLPVDEPRSSPCRVCLEDARVGETVLLFSYSPFRRAVPYRNLGPIFVHADGCVPYATRGIVPDLMRGRLLALRGYDSNDRLVECDLVEGKDVESLIERFFRNPAVRYLHAHNARAGCFLCGIERGAP